MGLPEINIVFQSKAETAIKRSANGIVALILRDATKGDITSYSYTNESEVVKSHWTTANYDYISKILRIGLLHREMRKRHLKPYFRMRRIMRVL